MDAKKWFVNSGKRHAGRKDSIGGVYMRYILITGINFNNKGAEAMMFHLYYYLQKKWPDKKVVALCKNSEQQLKKYREQYKLCTLSFYPADFFDAQGGLYSLAGRARGIQSQRNSANLRKVLCNADLCVDASGFVFSSKFGFLDNYIWLKKIELMKKFKIPVIVMPQSFGPFDYPKWAGWVLLRKAKGILQYPKKIYAREQSGFNLMKKYCLAENLFLSPDLVLLGEALNPKQFYRNLSLMKTYKMEAGSVAVIPNQKLKVHASNVNGEDIYLSAVRALLREGKRVYIIRHCDSDREFCADLADKFEIEDNVVYIDEEVDCIAFAKLIGQVDFAVASRYHGVVHSYKANTPCVVIGWADKYQELAREVAQEKYVIDLSGYDEHVLDGSIHEMCKNFQKERQIIAQKYNKLIENSNLYETAFD